MQINFKDEGHVYWLDGTDIKYKSVTTFKDQFKKPFPREYMSVYKALEELTGGKDTPVFRAYKNIWKEYGEDEGTKLLVNSNARFSAEKIRAVQAKILAKWDKAADDGKANGTVWHNKQEDKALITKRVFDGEGYTKLSEYYAMHADRPRLNSRLPDGTYVELLMALHPLKLAGQADRVTIETVNGVRYVDIDDWKTDKLLEFDNNFRKYFLSPINHIKECNFNGYAIQLGMYMYMCEAYGFVPRKMGITHVRDEVKWYKVPYWKKDIEKLLEIRLMELNLAA